MILGRFRVGFGWFRVVPVGSGWVPGWFPGGFRVGSWFYIHPIDCTQDKKEMEGRLLTTRRRRAVLAGGSVY